MLGAADMEPAYDRGFSKTRNFVLGWRDAPTTGTSTALIDYGSAETGYWTSAGMYQVSYGTRHVFPLPQIYTSGQVDNWHNLSSWGAANGNRGRIFFAGTFSEYHLGDHDPTLGGSSPNNCGYAPDVGFNTFTSTIQGDSQTHQPLRPFFKTDVVCHTSNLTG